MVRAFRVSAGTVVENHDFSSGLARDSVVNVSQLLTIDRDFLTEHAGTLPARLQKHVDDGLRTVLEL